MHGEALWNRFLQANELKVVIVNVFYRFTVRAGQLVMRIEIAFETERRVLHEDIYVVVNRGQRQRMNFLAHALVHSFGICVLAHFHQLLVNDKPLVSQGGSTHRDPPRKIPLGLLSNFLLIWNCSNFSSRVALLRRCCWGCLWRARGGGLLFGSLLLWLR